MTLDGPGIEARDVPFLIESTRTRHYLKREPTYELLNTVLKYVELLQEGGLQSHKTIQLHMSKLLVGTHMTVAFRNRSTGRPKIAHNLAAISKKKFPRSQYELMYTIAQHSAVERLGKSSEI